MTAYTRGDNNQCVEAIHRGFITIIEDDGNILYEIGNLYYKWIWFIFVLYLMYDRSLFIKL